MPVLRGSSYGFEGEARSDTPASYSLQPNIENLDVLLLQVPLHQFGYSQNKPKTAQQAPLCWQSSLPNGFARLENVMQRIQQGCIPFLQNVVNSKGMEKMQGDPKLSTIIDQ